MSVNVKTQANIFGDKWHEDTFLLSPVCLFVIFVTNITKVSPLRYCYWRKSKFTTITLYYSSIIDRTDPLIGVVVAMGRGCHHLATSQLVMSSPVSGCGQRWLKNRVCAKRGESWRQHDERLGLRSGARIYWILAEFILAPYSPFGFPSIFVWSRRFLESATFCHHAGTFCRDPPALHS